MAYLTFEDVVKNPHLIDVMLDPGQAHKVRQETAAALVEYGRIEDARGVLGEDEAAPTNEREGQRERDGELNLPYDLVLISWEDCYTRDAWQEVETLKEKASVMVVNTAGWLVKEDEAVVVIVPTLCTDDCESETERTCARSHVIPRRCIISTQVLLKAQE